MQKTEKKQQGEFIYGIHPLVEMLKSGRRKIYTLYTTKPHPKAFALIERHLPSYPIQKQYVARDVLTRMVGTTDHQGVVALVQPYPFVKQLFNPEKHKVILLLDELQDPRNLGAILRSAYCTGVDGVIITKKGGVSLTAAAFKASAGLAEYLQIYQAPSISAAVQELTRAGYTLYIASFKGKDARTVTYEQPCCIVIGSEGAGVHPSVLSAGIVVTLPQKKSDISYNASVAAGILLFLVTTQLNKI